jgi:zinc transport system substrate-binding protein
MQKKQIIGIGLLVAALCALVGIVAIQPNKPKSSKIHVAASFYPLYEFAKQVGGDKVEVTNVTPVGAEPHDYEPSPRTVADVSQSDVFIYNGGTLEPWADKVLADYHHTAIKGSDGIPLATNEDGKDPHYWLDPTLAAQTVDAIRDGLGKADPANKEYYTQQAAAYTLQLQRLHAQIREGLASCDSRTVVTSHQAFAYFGTRYNLTIVPIAGLSPDAEPSAAKLADVAKLVRDQHVTYIFFESLVSPRLAATIAQETGAKTAMFDPVEGLSNDAQAQGKNYISVQRDNLAALRTALACR